MMVTLPGQGRKNLPQGIRTFSVVVINIIIIKATTHDLQTNSHPRSLLLLLLFAQNALSLSIFSVSSLSQFEVLKDEFAAAVFIWLFQLELFLPLFSSKKIISYTVPTRIWKIKSGFLFFPPRIRKFVSISFFFGLTWTFFILYSVPIINMTQEFFPFYCLTLNSWYRSSVSQHPPSLHLGWTPPVSHE